MACSPDKKPLELHCQLSDFIHFSDEQQRQLYTCAAIAPCLADLATSHPLAFTALACGYGPKEGRLKAVELLQQGLPLAEVCRTLHIPYCLRRIPAEGCPPSLAFVKWGRGADKRMAPWIPANSSEAAIWLMITFFAARCCDDNFGIWLGREFRKFANHALSLASVLPLAVYVWHATNESSPLNYLCPGNWSTRNGMKGTVCDARRWLHRVALVAYFEARGETFNGLEFHPIDSLAAMLKEQAEMGHCIDAYAYNLRSGDCLLYSIQKDGVRLATMQLKRVGRCGWRMSQIKGPRNSLVRPWLRETAQQWLATCSQVIGPVPKVINDREMNETIAALLAPYKKSRSDCEQWMPDLDMADLEHSLANLARVYSTSNWMFSMRQFRRRPDR